MKIKKQMQNRHIEGKKEFEAYKKRLEIERSGYKPSILSTDAEKLVKSYAGTGQREFLRKSEFPIETIKANEIIGKYWNRQKGEYVETDTFVIVYSSGGVHVYPVWQGNLKESD